MCCVRDCYGNVDATSGEACRLEGRRGQEGVGQTGEHHFFENKDN
jgi:hypothetical protein